MNKLILAATAVAAVTVTTGCKHTVVRTVHHPVEVIDSRTVVHERTDVHIHEHREPPRIVEEVRVIRPQPVYVPVRPGHREPERRSHEPAHPAPPAHSNSRHNREAEAPRPMLYHSRERVEAERRERHAPVVIPPRTIKRQPVPSDRAQHRERGQEQRHERRAAVNPPARTIKLQPARPVIHPAPRQVLPQRHERGVPAMPPARTVKRQPAPPVIHAAPRDVPASRGHGPAQPANGRAPQNANDKHKEARNHRANGQDESDEHPSSRASDRGKERSAHNRRDQD